ncbi:MAG: ribosome silencing factor [Bacteroidales bacterium]
MEASEKLVEAIVEGIHRVKGQDVVSLQMNDLEHAFCDYFVICHGNSNTQVDAIADSVQETVRKEVQQKPWHKEGLNNSQWILLDYGDVLVHIFQKEDRNFYKLEDLWADATSKRYEDSVS